MTDPVRVYLFQCNERQPALRDLIKYMNVRVLEIGIYPELGQIDGWWCAWYDFETEAEAALFKLTHW